MSTWTTVPLGKHGVLAVRGTHMQGTATFECDSCTNEVMIFVSGNTQPGSQTTFQIKHRSTALSYVALHGDPTLEGVLLTIKTALNNTQCAMKWMP